MNAENGRESGFYYFPDRLRARLDRIPKHPMTVVEAPSGFGKTTAVREYLKKRRQAGARENWHTCLGEAPSRAWEGICGLFGGVDLDTAARLKELGPPTMGT
jgi:LuxR family maltose regulon positive regulatory protein